MKSWQADLLLLIVSALWGITFVVVKHALAYTPPFTFLTLRFSLAAIALLVLFPQHLRRVGVRGFVPGLITGLLLFVGYALQTYGLLYTSAARAGFITGLSVVFVPVAQAVLWRRPPTLNITMGVGLATVGLLLLGVPDGLSGGGEGPLPQWLGDLLVLVAAMAFAGHVLAVSFFSRRVTAPMLATGQIAVVAGSAAIAAFAFEDLYRLPVRALPRELIAAVLITGLLATALVFVVQSAVQRYTTATHAALIFTAEPVFAYLTAWWLLGESLSPVGMTGGGLIIGGMLLAETRHQPT